MIKTKLKFDRLASLLACYHILCVPTYMNKTYNPDVFKNLSVSRKERKVYLANLRRIGVNMRRSDKFRLDLFCLESKNLKDYFKRHGDFVSEEVQKNYLAFEPKFNRYFERVNKEIDPLIKVRRKEAQKYINKIYDTAQKFTGVAIERAEEMHLRVLLGTAPSSRGSDIENGKGYILIQKRNFLNPSDIFLISMIHETVAHQTVTPYGKYFMEIFNRRTIYEIEEGFAKLFSVKIAENLLKHKVTYYIDSSEKAAYNLFDKNWPSLTDKNFARWYKKCFQEIKHLYFSDE